VNKAITQVKPGETLEVLATDPAAVGDIKSWAERRGHVFVSAEKDGYMRITVMGKA
jgi:tRNA 2-thiouridine synthesizing protein A